MLLVLLACAPGDATSNLDGSADTAADTAADPDTAADTGEPLVFETLPVGCTPGTATDDPVHLATSLSVTADEPGESFMELLDVDIDGPEAWSVGQGGLVVGAIAGDGTLSQVHRDPGQGRYHRVELSPELVFLVHRDIGIESRPRTNLGQPGERMGAPGDEGMAVVGDRLYVANRSRGTVVYTLDGASLPTESGAGGGGGATWELAAVADTHLLGADNIDGVVVIDISSPDAPVLAATVSVGGSTYDIAVDGDYAYAAAGGDGVVVLDIGDPSSPVPVAWANTGGSAVSVAVSSGVLWVADHTAISAWNVADPLSPSPIGWEEVQQFALGVGAHAGGAVLGDWGFFEAWTLDTSVLAPALDTPLDGLRAANGIAEATLYNRGQGNLVLTDAQAEGATVLASASTIPPGGSATLRVAYEGTAPSSVCVGTNDPDVPTLTLAISADGDEAPVGEVAPDFSLPTVTGEVVRLSEQLGHPVMLSYFATW